MNKIPGNKKRVGALIGSGFLVVIIFPLIGIIVSLLIDNLFNLPKLIPLPINLIIAFPLLVWGFFWSIWSNYELFKVGKGSPVPLKDVHTIMVVSSGPYKFSRNPMIFGYIFIWVGLGILTNSFFLTFGLSVIVTLFLIIMVKIWEEKHLEQLFGEPYIKYKKEVSFIIPFKKKRFEPPTQIIDNNND